MYRESSRKSRQARQESRERAESRRHGVLRSEALMMLLLLTALVVSVWVMEMFI
jgi:cell division septal protein FtsQ